ncbi:ABC transporter substrate-binding protein [Trinickia dinghuensis]|uniref:ABC transporter substrate-binding protein n=1 Tax=Trinickia dinghuensis TaxID=2291023 RepID=A0A3D8K4Q9_9BURK|nr:ABC transporter substrate-binding protein [Trinickia dinghuensis]RDV00309.1 ABC transporter substrate-binding protein [Trinickia dinghuensis]
MKRIMLSCALLCAAQMGYAKSLTVVSWGGSYEDSQVATTISPFQKASGINVKVDNYSGGVAQVRAQVETKNVTWDVVDMQLSDAIRACDEGLLEKINPADLAPAKDGTPAAKDYMAKGLNSCMAGNEIWSLVVVYNKSKFKGSQPKTIADFFDLKRFPGKRAMHKSPEGALEWALMADGVPRADVYKTLSTPQGVDRAFKKLDTIKSSIVWWETGAQAPQLLADGEVTMAAAYNSRIYDAIVKDKQPFAFMWDGQLRYLEGYVIVKGTPHLEEARQFVRFATKPDILANLVSAVAFGPLRESAVPLVSDTAKPYLPTAPDNAKTALDVDFDWWADHSDDLNQRFATWLARN